MNQAKKEQLVPVLLAGFSPSGPENQLTPDEINIFVRIDGKTSLKGLATLLGISKSALHETLKKLEQQGAIELQTRAYQSAVDLQASSSNSFRSGAFPSSSHYSSTNSSSRHQSVSGTSSAYRPASSSSSYRSVSDSSGYRSAPSTSNYRSASSSPNNRAATPSSSKNKRPSTYHTTPSSQNNRTASPSSSKNKRPSTYHADSSSPNNQVASPSSNKVPSTYQADPSSPSNRMPPPSSSKLKASLSNSNTPLSSAHDQATRTPSTPSHQAVPSSSQNNLRPTPQQQETTLPTSLSPQEQSSRSWDGIPTFDAKPISASQWSVPNSFASGDIGEQTIAEISPFAHLDFPENIESPSEQNPQELDLASSSQTFATESESFSLLSSTTSLTEDAARSYPPTFPRETKESPAPSIPEQVVTEQASSYLEFSDEDLDSLDFGEQEFSEPQVFSSEFSHEKTNPKIVGVSPLQEASRTETDPENEGSENEASKSENEVLSDIPTEEELLQDMLGENLESHLHMEVHKHAASVLTSLARVTTSFQLYDPRNNAVRNALVGLYATMRSFLDKYELLPLTIEPWELQYEGQSVYRNKDREHSISFKLFRDGVRGITFRKGLPWSELAQFLKILGTRYGGVHMFEDDLVTLIWKAHFQYIEAIVVEGIEADKAEEEEDEFGAFMENTQDSENWQVYLPLHDEDLGDLLKQVRPVAYQYQALELQDLEALHLENSNEQLPRYALQLLHHMEQEVSHPENPMSSEPLKHYLQEFRDYLLTEGLHTEIVSLLQLTATWKQKHQELKALAEEFVQGFTEPRTLRRLLDGSKLEGEVDQETISPVSLQLLEQIPYNFTNVLFELLSTENRLHLRKVIRLALLEKNQTETKLYIDHLEGASDEFSKDLLFCLYQISNTQAVEAIAKQVENANHEVSDCALYYFDLLLKRKQEKVALEKVIGYLLRSEDIMIRLRAYRLIQLSNDSRWANTLLQILKENTEILLEEQKQLAQLSAEVSPRTALTQLLKLAEPSSRFAMEHAFRKQQRRAALAGLALIPLAESEEQILFVLKQMHDEYEDDCVRAMRVLRRSQKGNTSFLELSSIIPAPKNKAPTEQKLHENQTFPDFYDQQGQEEIESYGGAKEVDIEQIQQQMLRALQHTGGGSNNEMGNQIRGLGFEFLMLLHMLLKTSRLYDASNAVFEQPLQDFSTLISRLQNLLGEISLVGVDGQFYLNDTRIRTSRESSQISVELYEDLRRVGIGGLIFAQPFSSDEVRTFIHLLSAFESKEQGALEELRKQLRQFGFEQQVELLGPVHYKIGSSEKKAKIGEARSALKSYSKANYATTDLWKSVSTGRTPNPLPLRKASNDFVDALSGHQENSLEALAVGYRQHPLTTHTLNVTMYSIQLGKYLGLSSTQLADLAMASLYHDIGYIIPPEQVNAPQVGSQPSLSHQSTGFRFFARQRGFHDGKVKRLLAIIEHHTPAKPQSSQAAPSLFSRIIKIADVYDLLTTPLTKGVPLSPHHALQVLAGSPDHIFDPALVQIFINVLGQFPAGTVVELNDKSIGLSLGYNGMMKSFERPRILLLKDSQGNNTQRTIDLSQKEKSHLRIISIQKIDPIRTKQILSKKLQYRVQAEQQTYR